MLGIHADQMLFAHQVHQHHGPQLAIGLMVDSLQALQGAVNHPHSLALLQQFFWGAFRHVAQSLDQIVGHGGGTVAKTHQTAHPKGGANRRPVGVLHVQADEQIAAEHGLDHLGHAATAQLFKGDHGQPGFKALVLQVFQGSVFLLRAGMDGVPQHGFRGVFVSLTIVGAYFFSLRLM